MQNFTKINAEIIVSPLLAELSTNADLWDTITARTGHELSPFKEVSDIWLRYNGDLSSVEAVINGLECICYPGWHRLPTFRKAIFGLAGKMEAFRIGRCLITRLPPGGKMTAHVDQGENAKYYDRFQMCLQATEGSLFHCGGETVTMLPGDIYWFNNKKEHSVENNGTVDRIHIIVDLRL